MAPYYIVFLGRLGPIINIFQLAGKQYSMWGGSGESRSTSCGLLVFSACALACIFCFGPILYFLLCPSLYCFLGRLEPNIDGFQLLCNTHVQQTTSARYMHTRRMETQTKNTQSVKFDEHQYFRSFLSADAFSKMCSPPKGWPKNLPKL